MYIFIFGLLFAAGGVLVYAGIRAFRHFLTGAGVAILVIPLGLMLFMAFWENISGLRPGATALVFSGK